MIRTAIISMLASFVLVGVWTVNYHPATDLNPIAHSARTLTDHPMIIGREMMSAAAAMIMGTLVIALVGSYLI
ncbi:MAG: hypothetical protein WCD78_03315 [Pseudolabrys sp.]